MRTATLPLFLINNTGADISMFYPAITEALTRGDELPEEIADIFAITFVPVGSEVRVRIDFA